MLYLKHLKQVITYLIVATCLIASCCHDKSLILANKTFKFIFQDKRNFVFYQDFIWSLKSLLFPQFFTIIIYLIFILFLVQVNWNIWSLTSIITKRYIKLEYWITNRFHKYVCLSLHMSVFYIFSNLNILNSSQLYKQMKAWKLLLNGKSYFEVNCIYFFYIFSVFFKKRDV